MADIGVLRGLIILDDQFTPRLKLASDQLKTTAKDFRAAGESIQSMGRDLLPISVAISGASAAVFTLGKNFEVATSKLETLSGVTTSMTDEMRDGMLDLSKSVAIGPNALADAMLVVTSTGIRGAEAMDVLTAAAKASAVGLGDTKDVARAVTSAMNAYGKENLSAAEATETLFKTVREGGAEANEMAGVLGRIVGIASQVGVSFQEVGAFMATFTRLGVDSAEAVTALRGVLSTVLSPTKEAREQLEMMGSSVQALREEIRQKGLTAALTDLVKMTNGSDEALAAIIPNVRALAGVMGTAGSQAEAMAEIQRVLMTSTNDLDKAFVRAGENTDFKWNQALADAERIAIKTFQTFREQFAGFADGIREFVAWGDRVLDWFTEFGRSYPIVVNGFAAITALVAVSSPLLIGLGLFVKLVAASASGLSILSGLLATNVVAVNASAAATTELAAAQAAYNVSGLNVVTTTNNMIAGMSAAGAAANANYIASQTMIAGMSASGRAAAAAAGGVGTLTLSLGTLLGLLTIVPAALYALWKAAEYGNKSMEKAGLDVYGLKKKFDEAGVSTKALDEDLVNFRKSMDALAARDNAAKDTATKRMKQDAEDLAKALPAAFRQMDRLTSVFKDMRTEGTLTRSVMLEMGREASALAASGVVLNAELAELAQWFDRIQSERNKPPAPGKDPLTSSTESLRSWKEQQKDAKKELLELDLTIGSAIKNHVDLNRVLKEYGDKAIEASDSAQTWNLQLGKNTRSLMQVAMAARVAAMEGSNIRPADRNTTIPSGNGDEGRFNELDHLKTFWDAYDEMQRTGFKNSIAVQTRAEQQKIAISLSSFGSQQNILTLQLQADLAAEQERFDNQVRFLEKSDSLYAVYAENHKRITEGLYAADAAARAAFEANDLQVLREFRDKNVDEHLKGTNLRVAQLERERASALRSLKSEGDARVQAMAAIDQYYDTQIAKLSKLHEATEALKGGLLRIKDAALGNLGSLFFGFGKDTRQLKIDADKTEQEYLRLKRSGKATAEELTLAFQRFHDAEALANNVWGERWKDFMHSLKQTWESVLNDMLKYFAEGFLKQLIAKIAGAKLAERLGLGISGATGGSGKNALSSDVIGSAIKKGLSKVPGIGGLLGGGGGSAFSVGTAATSSTLASAAVPASLSMAAAPALLSSAGISAGVGAGAGAGAGAGSAAGTAGATAGLSASTIGLTAGIGAAAVLAWAIWKKGLFRGGEEALKVNGPRDRFLSQWGNPSNKGVGGGAHRLAAQLTSFGAGDGGGVLMTDLLRADKERTFKTAENNIVTFLSKHGVHVKTFHVGGVIGDIFGGPSEGLIKALVGESVLTRDATEAIGGKPVVDALNAGDVSGAVERIGGRSGSANAAIASTGHVAGVLGTLGHVFGIGGHRHRQDASQSDMVDAIAGRGGVASSVMKQMQGANGPSSAHGSATSGVLHGLFGIGRHKAFHDGGVIDSIFGGAQTGVVKALVGESVLNRQATAAVGGRIGVDDLNSGSVRNVINRLAHPRAADSTAVAPADIGTTARAYRSVFPVDGIGRAIGSRLFGFGGRRTNRTKDDAPERTRAPQISVAPDVVDRITGGFSRGVEPTARPYHGGGVIGGAVFGGRHEGLIKVLVGESVLTRAATDALGGRAAIAALNTNAERGLVGPVGSVGAVGAIGHVGPVGSAGRIGSVGAAGPVGSGHVTVDVGKIALSVLADDRAARQSIGSPPAASFVGMFGRDRQAADAVGGVTPSTVRSLAQTASAAGSAAVGSVFGRFGHHQRAASPVGAPMLTPVVANPDVASSVSGIAAQQSGGGGRDASGKPTLVYAPQIGGVIDSKTINDVLDAHFGSWFNRAMFNDRDLLRTTIRHHVGTPA